MDILYNNTYNGTSPGFLRTRVAPPLPAFVLGYNKQIAAWRSIWLWWVSFVWRCEPFLKNPGYAPDESMDKVSTGKDSR